MSRSPRLEQLTWEDAGEALARAELALLPVGSTEQHGPHMRLSTDTRVAEGFCDRLEEELGDLAVRCPTIAYGLSEHHVAFPGTLTLTPATFIDAVLEVVASLAGHGLSRVVVVNGHGGNLDALSIVSRRARIELGARVASVMWSRLAADVVRDVAFSDSYGHACDVETAVAMVLAPDCVDTSRIAAPRERPGIDPAMAPPTARADIAIGFDELTSDGVLGDPRQANREVGERVVDTAVVRARAIADALRRHGKDGADD